MSKIINADRDLQDIVIDFLGVAELRLSELEEELQIHPRGHRGPSGCLPHL